ncbi:MAG: hypothetical protein IPL73_19820 [Candidatus Obscuribacter sp.]|nr:hypothetical protein [Candidatus Obscuribacter sp.]
MADKAPIDHPDKNLAQAGKPDDRAEQRFDTGAADKSHNLSQSVYARPEDFRQSIILAQTTTLTR